MAQPTREQAIEAIQSMLQSNPDKVEQETARILTTGRANNQTRPIVEQLNQAARQRLSNDYLERQAQSVLTPEIQELVSARPEDMFFATQKLMTSDVAPQYFTQLRAINAAAKAKLLEANIDPNQVMIRDKPLQRVVQPIFNALSVPVNLSAGIIGSLVSPSIRAERNRDVSDYPNNPALQRWVHPQNTMPAPEWRNNRPITGTSGGYANLIHTVLLERVPELKTILEKLSYGQQLSGEELGRSGANFQNYAYIIPSLKKLVSGQPISANEEKTIYALYQAAVNTGGTLANILLDPTNIHTSALGNVNRLTRAASRFNQVNHFDDVVRSGARFAVQNANDIPGAAHITEMATDLLNAERKLNIDDLSNVRNAFRSLRSQATDQQTLSRIDKILGTMDTNMNRSVQYAERMAHGADLASMRPQRIIPQQVRQSFLTSDNPLARIGRGARRLFISDVPTEARGIFREGATGGRQLTNIGEFYRVGINKFVKRWVRPLKVDDGAMNRFLSNTLELGRPSINSSGEFFYGLRKVIPDEAETKLFNAFTSNTKFADELGNVSTAIRSAYDKMLINSLKEGYIITPAGLNENALKEYKNLANEYISKYAANRNSNEVKTHEQILSEYISKYNRVAEQGFAYPLKDTEAVQYLTRMLSDIANKFYEANGLGRNQTSNQLLAFNLSMLKRNIDETLTIAEINKRIKNILNSGSDDARKLFGWSESGDAELNKAAEQAASFWQDFVRQYPNENLFNENVGDLVSAYFRRNASSVRNAIIDRGLVKLLDDPASSVIMSRTSVRGMKAAMIGNSKVWVVPEIASEIEKIKSFSQPSSFIKAYDKVLGMLRKITLLPFMSYYNRNALGNGYAMLLSGQLSKNPVRLARSAGESVMLMRWGGTLDRNALKRFSVSGARGQTFFGDEIMDSLSRQGIFERFVPESMGNSKPVGRVLDTNVNVLSGLSERVESQAKIMLFLESLKNGNSLDEAGAIVKKYLFDYGDITRFESDVVRRLTYFYTWFRKNMSIQLENALGFMTRSTMKAWDGLNKRDKDNFIDASWKSEWLASSPLLLLNRKNNKETGLLLESFLPPFDLWKVLRIITIPGDAKDEIIGMINPILKNPAGTHSKL
jgi:hypothetical protein